MNYYYNKEGIGDTLIIDFLTETSDVEPVRKGDAVVLRQSNGDVVGANLFHASQYITINGNGKIKVDDELAEKISKVFEENGFSITFTPDTAPDFIVGEVKEKKAHPDADKLSVCMVDVGSETWQIVCGAPNVEAGQRVVVARIGALMPNGQVIKPSVLRGVRSEGMICSARELGLPNAPAKKGILVLDSSYEVGTPFTIEAK
ncbi:YtpR family tRNA-binding protein [Tuberibacillus calidus]|uniref:YtpR family tRNA-binding protein n=1 Tax=Tuberibacillus calidus TaxID=340097 RepID=UPI000423BEBD|nr:DUF4479 domain-containing protein [Tuberibacillus calidus]